MPPKLLYSSWSSSPIAGSHPHGVKSGRVEWSQCISTVFAGQRGQLFIGGKDGSDRIAGPVLGGCRHVVFIELADATRASQFASGVAKPRTMRAECFTVAGIADNSHGLLRVVRVEAVFGLVVFQQDGVDSVFHVMLPFRWEHCNGLLNRMQAVYDNQLITHR